MNVRVGSVRDREDPAVVWYEEEEVEGWSRSARMSDISGSILVIGGRMGTSILNLFFRLHSSDNHWDE